MHCIGDSVDAENSCGMTRNAVYFLIGPFFATKEEGGAAKCSSVGSKSAALHLYLSMFIGIAAIVVDVTIRGVEIIQIGSTVRPMGDATWW